MKKSKLGYLIIAFLLVWALAQFFFLPAICSAEPVYMITETELVTLEQNSNRQLEISSQLAQELQTAKKQLKASEKESTEAKLQKEQLQKQLIELEASSKIDVDHYVSGISYGVSRRIGSKYIGLRGEYDWGEKKAGVWLTYTY